MHLSRIDTDMLFEGSEENMIRKPGWMRALHHHSYMQTITYLHTHIHTYTVEDVKIPVEKSSILLFSSPRPTDRIVHIVREDPVPLLLDCCWDKFIYTCMYVYDN